MAEPSREQAQLLLRKAREDAYICRTLSADPQASPWIVGFHAQQAVEKSIKAVLGARGVRYPYTHDIEVLLKLLHRNGVSPPPDAENLPRLTPLAVLMRYEDELDEPPSPTLKREWLAVCTEETVRWAEATLRE